jgi:hypothetical protein
MSAVAAGPAATRRHLFSAGVLRAFADRSSQGPFARVVIGSAGEIRWSDEVDLCADALYLEITGKQPAEVFPNLGKVSAHA